MPDPRTQLRRPLRTGALAATPGLYRLSVRVQLEGDRMSCPIYRYLRVLG